VASAQSSRSNKGDGKSISRREYLLTEAEELVAEVGGLQVVEKFWHKRLF
jgi:hypothetical protein